MKIFLLLYICHFAIGLTHCYKTTVFLHLLLLLPAIRWYSEGRGIWLVSVIKRILAHSTT